MRHTRTTLVLLTLLTVVGLVAAPLVLHATGHTTYVGQSGISHDGDGGRMAHINTCGETVTRVEVSADGHTYV